MFTNSHINSHINAFSTYMALSTYTHSHTNDTTRSRSNDPLYLLSYREVTEYLMVTPAELQRSCVEIAETFKRATLIETLN